MTSVASHGTTWQKRMSQETVAPLHGSRWKGMSICPRGTYPWGTIPVPRGRVPTLGVDRGGSPHRCASRTDRGGSLPPVRALRASGGLEEVAFQRGVVRARSPGLKMFLPSGTKVSQKFPRCSISTQFHYMLIVMPFAVLVGAGLAYSSCHRRSSLDG
jgi:hypothetical protein